MNEIMMNLGYLQPLPLSVFPTQIPQKCVVCSQPCFIQIPLDLFVYGNQQMACSENCKNLFQLAKSLTAQQQQLNAYAQQYLNQPSSMSSKPGLLPTPTYGVAVQPSLSPSRKNGSRANSTDIPKPHNEFKSKQKKNKAEQKKKFNSSKPSSPKFQKVETTPNTQEQRSPKFGSVANASTQPDMPAREPVIAVIDTNCLIQRLSDIVNLQHQSHVTVIIPQIVIHELDRLKSNEDRRVGSHAQQAIKMLKEIMQDNQSIVKKFRTQETHEAIADNLVGIRNNDDLVIQCARYFHSVAPNKTVLVTGDAGLSLKAVMHGIQSKKVSDFLSSLPPVFHKVQGSPVQSVSTPQRDNLPYLPAALWNKVFSYLPPRQLPRVSQVCYSFHSIMNKDDTVWRSNLQRTFNDYNNVLIPQNVSAKSWYVKWREQTLTYRHSPTRAT